MENESVGGACGRDPQVTIGFKTMTTYLKMDGLIWLEGTPMTQETTIYAMVDGI